MEVVFCSNLVTRSFFRWPEWSYVVRKVSRNYKSTKQHFITFLRELEKYQLIPWSGIIREHVVYTKIHFHSSGAHINHI